MFADECAWTLLPAAQAELVCNTTGKAEALEAITAAVFTGILAIREAASPDLKTFRGHMIGNSAEVQNLAAWPSVVLVGPFLPPLELPVRDDTGTDERRGGTLIYSTLDCTNQSVKFHSLTLTALLFLFA